MKRTITVGMTMSALLCTGVLAQNLPMLASKEALHAYALEQTSQVSASVDGALPVGNNTYVRVPVESPTAAGIINTLRDTTLSVNVANPRDYLHISAGAYTSDGDPLFTGYNRFKLVETEGGFVLPAGYGDVTLSLYDEIPIPIQGALTAHISIQNERGETEYGTSIPVNNGKVYFPEALTGAKALLSVYCDSENGGEWLYWSIANGRTITPQQFAVGVTPTIRGIVTVTDGDVLVPITTTQGVGENITAELTVTEDSAFLVSFWTSENKWFTGAWVREAGTDKWYYRPAVAFSDVSIMGIKLRVDSGVYYIIPTWTDGDLIERPDAEYPPYGSGGGGKG